MLSCRAMLGVGLLAISSLCQAQQAVGRAPSSLRSLAEGFQTPPAEAKLRCYWWWLNGNTDETTITHDLEQMHAKGIGGVILVDAGGASQNDNGTVPAGPRFGSPAWVRLYRHALQEADRLGLEVTLNIQSGWNVGGPTVTPADAAKLLTFDHVDIRGGHPQDITLPRPPSRLFYRDIAVLAYPLHHGTALAPQVQDQQGDAYTVRQQADDSVYPPALRLRAAAVEGGFSMNDASGLLNDGVGSVFQSDPRFADAAPDEVRVLQLTRGDTVHIDLPAGEWELLRIGYTDSGATVSTSSDTWKGLAIDYLSRRAFDDYWNQNVKPLLEDAKPFHSLKYLATDSWEVGGTNWTDDFREQFQQRRGYDPVPYLPIVAGRILGDRSVSTRFLTDLRRTVADLIVANHDDLFAERAAAFGLGVQAETGGPHAAPMDGLETFRHAAMPQTEFWAQNEHRGEDRERFFVKEAASAANIYGQPFAADEGETSIGPQWSESLSDDLKPTFDMAVTEGMNRLVWHEFTSSPASMGLPGQEYFAGTHLNPNITWWQQAPAFFDYLNRVQFLMQRGTAVNDVLYYYGDNVPNFARLKADDPAHVLPGYDYDVTDEDALLRTIRIDGRDLVGPSGMRWHMLALPKTRRLSLAMLQLVERYLQAGGAVVSLPPLSTTGNIPAGEADTFHALVQRMWGGCSTGIRHYASGTIFCTMDTHAALAERGIAPDVVLLDGGVLGAGSANDIDYIHRRDGGNDIYFVRNGYGVAKDITLSLRATGTAQLWDPVSGERSTLATQPDGAQRTVIHLQLAAYGSAVVVFPTSDAAMPLPQTKREVRTEPFIAQHGWTIRFQPGRGAPAHAFTVTTLTDWTGWGEGLAGFSGTATYRAQFTAPAIQSGERLCLRFTSVREIATILVNGETPQTVWARPYLSCLSTLLRRGENTLEVRVTNLWFNRLAADARLPANQRLTQTNIRVPADSAPLPSGLIGPVEWVVETTDR